MFKPVALTPLRLSEVLADTTWELFERAGADCCVPIGLVNTLMCNSNCRF